MNLPSLCEFNVIHSNTPAPYVLDVRRAAVKLF